MKENGELVSVVIPVYNVEKYLSKCIESVLKQSYSNLDIILVDDGSTDKSGNICDSYMTIDQRIRVFHKKNGGLSDARNFGIKHALGTYITFIDSDDYVLTDYIMHLYRLITHFCGDISITCTEKIYNNKVTLEYEKFTLEKSIIFSPEKALEDMLYRKNLPIYAVAKMYKIELFNTILFPKGELFEDLSTIYKLYHKSSTIVFNPIKDYCYIQRDTSIVNSNYSSKKMIQVYTTERIIRFAKKYYPNIVKAAKSKCFITTLNHYRFIPKEETFKQDRTYCKKLIKKYRLTVFRDRNNKLIVRLLALACFVNINFLRYLSFIYQYLIKKGVLRLKRPI